jgi:hypothetical protein
MKSEDLMTMNIKVIVMWDVMLCSLVARYKCFGGTILGYDALLFCRDTYNVSEAAGSLILLVPTYQNTWCHIPDD